MANMKPEEVLDAVSDVCFYLTTGDQEGMLSAEDLVDAANLLFNWVQDKIEEERLALM